MKNIYLAGGIYSGVQKDMVESARTQLDLNESVGDVFDPFNERTGVPFDPNDQAWKLATFQSDLHGIEGSDVVVALYDVDKPDTGTVFEIGYAYAIHKPVLLVVSRDDAPINLMELQGATNVTTIEVLSLIDFKRPLRYTITDMESL